MGDTISQQEQSRGDSPADQVGDLTTLNDIVQTLNRAVDVRSALNTALARLVELMGLDSGLIYVKAPAPPGLEQGGRYELAAHHNLPPALAPDDEDMWAQPCQCQRLCDAGALNEAYNVVGCSRLAAASGDRRGLALHASAPLRSGERTLGILNVIGRDRGAFNPRALALLTNVGNQMGIALERAQLYDLLREQRVSEGKVLLDVSNQLLSRLDLDDVMDYLVEEVCRLLRADGCALMLAGETPGSLTFTAASGWRSDPAALGRQVPVEPDGGLDAVMRRLQPVLVADIQATGEDYCGGDLLHGEGFRGHAVIPLINDGRAIGALMISARQPRLLDEDEVRFLRLMANQAAIAIETARLHREEVERQVLAQELAVARQIQRGLLPQDRPAVPGWEFASSYRAAHQVGGDFYDFLTLPGEAGRLGIVVADVAGKGVPAALMMALGRTVVRAAAADGRDPSCALDLANRLLMDDSQANLFVTAFYAVLDTATGRLTYANAGHNRPLLLRAKSGEMEELAAKGIALNVFDDIALEQRVAELAPGDLVGFYTDGVTEALDAAGQPFGDARLRAALAGNLGARAEQTLAGVLEAVYRFAGDTPPSDDLTLIVAKRLAPAD